MEQQQRPISPTQKQESQEVFPVHWNEITNVKAGILMLFPEDERLLGSVIEGLCFKLPYMQHFFTI